MSEIFKTIIPIAGSIGYLYYLSINGKLSLKPRSLENGASMDDRGIKPMQIHPTALKLYPNLCKFINSGRLFPKSGPNFSLDLDKENASSMYFDYINKNDSKVIYIRVPRYI